MPTQYAHQDVLFKGKVDWVDIYLIGKPERIARHHRSYAKADFVVDQTTVASQILLVNHLKVLKLPTFAR